MECTTTATADNMSERICGQGPRARQPAFAPTARSPSLACPRYPIALVPASLMAVMGELERRSCSTTPRPASGTGATTGARSPVAVAVVVVVVVSNGGRGEYRRSGARGDDGEMKSSEDGGGDTMISCERLLWSCLSAIGEREYSLMCPAAGARCACGSHRMLAPAEARLGEDSAWRA